ncbi:MAG: YeeE/YedE family protein [Rhodobacteraceae bacterium]|nr:YeeE/YedE family protein [Paracoccaceae bacterium]
MFESLGLESLTPRSAALILGLALGAVFGALAEVSAFCFRRGIVAGPDRRAALGTWMMALAVAVGATQAAVLAGVLDLSGHRLLAAELPWLAIGAGGLAFGAGMVLARGCPARLTVLAASGNLRAALVLLVFALVAQAAMKGALAPLVQAVAAPRLDIGTGLAALPFGTLPAAAALVAASLAVAWRSGAPRHVLAAAAGIGLLVAMGWLGTGLVLQDEFDPITVESLAFTAPMADTLFWTAAATAVQPGFGPGLIGGTLTGAFALAWLSGRFRWHSFTGPAETGRYLAGAGLMGVGGVLAGGCTIGAGLSGIPTLSLAAVLALAAIAAGAVATDRALSAAGRGSAGSAARPPAVPAE